jgi:hypothetical protein
LLAKGLEFILVCKLDSLKTLYEWVNDLERNGVVNTMVRKRWTGKRHETDSYRYVSAVPLRDANNVLTVRCEITTRSADGKVLYRNAFATSLAVDDASVAESGCLRSRKVED